MTFFKMVRTVRTLKWCRQSKFEFVMVWLGFYCQGCARPKWVGKCRMPKLHNELHWRIKDHAHLY